MYSSQMQSQSKKIQMHNTCNYNNQLLYIY